MLEWFVIVYAIRNTVDWFNGENYFRRSIHLRLTTATISERITSNFALSVLAHRPSIPLATGITFAVTAV